MPIDTAPPSVVPHVFDNLTVDEIRRRGTAKWSRYAEDVLAAWVAEMDFPLAPELRAALHDAVECGCTGYAPEAATDRLAAACASWMSTSFGSSFEPRQIRIVPDVLRGVELAIKTFSRPGSPVVLLTPAYPPFFDIVRQCGGQAVEAPLATARGGWGIDLDAVETALRAGAGTVMLCNPHNPLGKVYTRDELTALASLVETHGARVVVDEIHAPLVYRPAEHVQYAALSDSTASHAVTIVSASKGWNIPGLKCAEVVLSNEADIARWDQLSWLETHGASIMGILANRVAFEQGQPSLAQVLDVSGQQSQASCGADRGASASGALRAPRCYLPCLVGLSGPRDRQPGRILPAARKSRHERRGEFWRRRSRLRSAQLRHLAPHPDRDRTCDGRGNITPGYPRSPPRWDGARGNGEGGSVDHVPTARLWPAGQFRVSDVGPAFNWLTPPGREPSRHDVPACRMVPIQCAPAPAVEILPRNDRYNTAA